MITYADNYNADKCLGKRLVLVVTLELEATDLVVCEPGDVIPLEIIASNQSA